MWVFLGEFAIGILLVGVILAALLWFGPFLLFRELLDRLTGNRGTVEKALDERAQEELLTLKQFSTAELVAHPGHYAPKQIIIAGRRARFTWGTNPSFNADLGTIDVVLEHELYLFNIAISPKSHGVDGFKVMPDGARVDMTPEELSQYD